MSNKEKILNVTPLGDRLLVKHIDEGKEQIKGGIIIPDSAKEKPQEAKIIALGTGPKDDNGNLITFDVKIGDTVIISKYGGTELEMDGEQYKIVRQEDILAIIN